MIFYVLRQYVWVRHPGARRHVQKIFIVFFRLGKHATIMNKKQHAEIAKPIQTMVHQKEGLNSILYYLIYTTNN